MNARASKGKGESVDLAANGRAPLRECVHDALDHYFESLDGHEVSGLFELVMGEVEAPLLESVMRRTDGNLTRAAEVLGINRATLRRKLERYRIG